MKRFLDKIEKTDECWLWKAATFSNGYGAFYLPKELRTSNHRQAGAHQFSYLFYYGYDSNPENLQVLHKDAGLSIALASKEVGLDRRNGWAIIHRKTWTHI